ncbi:MAG: hypothetical protein RLZZ117_613 [Cyanobacteriota bacterium]|jgi:acyl carrier protein
MGWRQPLKREPVKHRLSTYLLPSFCMKAIPQACQQLLAALSSISLPPSDLDQVGAQLREDPAALSLVDLGLDSLGGLEMCIALELNHGLLLTPELLRGLSDAGQLLRRIASAPRVGSVDGLNQGRPL